jgi:hypothetical protein
MDGDPQPCHCPARGGQGGSIKVGKDADVVVWSDNPLSIYARAEKTIVDGTVYFDCDHDMRLPKRITAECNLLMQKILAEKRTSSPMAQEDAYPAPPSKGVFYISNATIHVGNGEVINNDAIKVNNGKIVTIGTGVNVQGDGKVYDAKGKQVYPGLIFFSSSTACRQRKTMMWTSLIKRLPY